MMIGTNNPFEAKRGVWLAVWGLVVLLGATLLGLAFYADSYQGEQIPCPFLFQTSLAIRIPMGDVLYH